MKLALALVPLALAATALAQQPQYRVTAAVPQGGVVRTSLSGPRGAAFVSLIDLGSGPQLVLDELFYLAFSPWLTVVDAGTLDATGGRSRGFGVPIVFPSGLPLYWQSVVLDASAPNGLYRNSDGESTVVYGSLGVLVEDFTDAAAQGYEGDYDRTKLGRLQGAPARKRVQHTVPGGLQFPQPIIGPLNPFGERIQMVLRAGDLGAVGKEELVTAVRWLPLGPVVSDSFSDLSLELAHSSVLPDYTIDPTSALPRFPNSGLALTFANNVKQGESLQPIYRGPYQILPGDQRADGYLPYPTLQRLFVYNGVDSLLLDFKMSPSTANGANGQTVYLQVQSSPRPNSRVYDRGTVSNPVNPHTSLQAQDGDNAVHDMQIEFTRVKSTATSPWRDSRFTGPDYQPPVLAQTQPLGTAIGVEYRGSALPDGSNPTAWSNNIDGADGMRFLQMRVSLHGSLFGDVPSLDAIVVPIN